MADGHTPRCHTCRGVLATGRGARWRTTRLGAPAQGLIRNHLRSHESAGPPRIPPHGCLTLPSLAALWRELPINFPRGITALRCPGTGGALIDYDHDTESARWPRGRGRHELNSRRASQRRRGELGTWHRGAQAAVLVWQRLSCRGGYAWVKSRRRRDAWTLPGGNLFDQA